MGTLLRPPAQCEWYCSRAVAQGISQGQAPWGMQLDGGVCVWVGGWVFV